MTKIDNYTPVKSWPEKIGRLQLVHSTVTKASFTQSAAVYCEAPTRRTFDVSMQAECYGGSGCDCEDCYGGGECEHTLGMIGERCVEANEMFSVNMPWQYYVLRAQPQIAGYGSNGKTELVLSIRLDRIIWSFFGPDQPEKQMLWCPLLNIGGGNGICAPTFTTTPEVDVPESTVAEVFDKLLFSNWNTDNGYMPSAFYNWVLGKKKYDGSQYEDMMSFYGKWQALSHDDVFRAPHNAAGWTLETFLKNPMTTYINDPTNSDILWLEEGGEVKSAKNSVDLPSRIRYY